MLFTMIRCSARVRNHLDNRKGEVEPDNRRSFVCVCVFKTCSSGTVDVTASGTDDLAFAKNGLDDVLRLLIEHWQLHSMCTCNHCFRVHHKSIFGADIETGLNVL